MAFRGRVIDGQRDFSLGEVDVSVKRRDDLAIVKSGARQCSNFRILNSGALENRPGRSALFLEKGRIEEVLMAPGQIFYLAFGAGYLNVYNASGVRVLSATVKGDGITPIPWTSATVKNIVWCVYQTTIYITYGDGFPANVPQVLTWDGVSQTSTWTLTTYTELLNGNQKRTFFYRVSPQNLTLQPSATSGSITLIASAPVFQPGHVGTRIRWVGRQILITGFTDSQHVSATVEEPLNISVNISVTGNAQNTFAIGDVIEGSISAAKAQVISIGAEVAGVSIVSAIMLTGAAFGTNDEISGPSGTLPIDNSFIPPSTISPLATNVWDDEVMNTFRGYPQSCFFDQSRLGFCNFPVVPSGIGWSSVGNTTDLYVEFSTSTPDNAIFEIAPQKSQVLYVIAGMESSEFVFCDNAVYYIPITVTNPLQPGSVAFNQLTSAGSAQVQPRPAQQSIVYVAAGGIKIMAVQAPGAYYRPYVVDDVSELHAHLFTVSPPIAIAIPPAPAIFEERYIYVLLANGAYVVGKYTVRSGLLEPGPEGKPLIGWTPASGAGTISWIASQAGDVIFTTSYPITSSLSVSMVEKLDQTQFLDVAMFYNNAPAALAPPPGAGPLWFMAGGACWVWDSGRPMGAYQIDGSGRLIPQFTDGENLADPSLVVGQMWFSTLVPWIPNAPPGQDAGQRMYPRKIARTAVAVENSTGFVLQRLYSQPTQPGTLTFGTPVSQIRFPYYEQGEDPTKAAPLRERTYWKRWLGRSYDPLLAIIKDQPGPLRIVEVGHQVTV